MHKRLSRIIPVIVGLFLFSAITQAEELTANVGVTSNYVFRGVTQTDDGFAIQGGVDWVHDAGIYAGAWASNVEDAAGNDGFEIDAYVGFNIDIGNDMGIDVGYIAYEYTDNSFTDVEELYFGFRYKDLSVTYFDGEPDNGSDYYYLDAKYMLELQKDVKLNFHYGHMEVDGSNNDADDVSVGISKEFQGLDISLTFTSYDHDRSVNDEDEIFVTVTKTFDL